MNKLKSALIVLLLSAVFFSSLQARKRPKNNPPIYIAFLWHMHQPIYYPGETIIQTEQAGHFSYSLFDIHNQRWGPYTSWPKDAVQKGIDANLGHLGAQVSFSGSLIDNLNNLEAYGNGNFQNWKESWNYIKNKTTSLGNPRIDMVGFGYFHPLMGLIDYDDIRRQIRMHRDKLASNFPGAYSKGIFPPEDAFAPEMIPALKSENLDWVIIDNIHFERACQGYPFNTGGNLYEPNKADILNPDPDDWLQLNGIWAPTKVSAQWSSQPHYAEYINPVNGEKSKIIAVPADRYMGNEDGRGGFGALNYENVMSQLESYNTDPNHPILIVLHHDGDNYGGGTDSYYGSNFQNFVNWLSANPDRFVCTTIQDYLDMYPPDENDIIHIENGSWSGADNGDPEFKKWLGDPGGDGYSPDRNSWGVITAAKNLVETAADIAPNSDDTKKAEEFLMTGEASDYWYWDGSLDGIWDANPTRAANLAVPFAQNVITGGADNTPPTIFKPQREPYNPGGKEWETIQPSDFTVWSFVYDLNGLSSVKLKFRTDNDGVNDLSTSENETYAGGGGVSEWNEIEMDPKTITPQTAIQPIVKADEYSAEITGYDNVLIDYYIEAADNRGNTAKSSIAHVWVGNYNSGGGTGNLTIEPENPTRDDIISISINNVSQNAKLHWGVNNSGSSWQTPNQVYWTTGSELFNGTGPAVESPFSAPDTAGTISIRIGPFNKPEQQVDRIAFVIHYSDNTWDNNNGNDYSIDFGGGSGGDDFVMDGNLDANTTLLSSAENKHLYVGWNSPVLYVATESALTNSNDMFIFIAGQTSPFSPAPWAKSGQVMQWSAYLGNESDNNWNGWFDETGTAENASGEFLEGAINLEEEFGSVPSAIYIAVGEYETPDNGALVGQIPSGNSDGNIDANEFVKFDYAVTDIETGTENPAGFELFQNYPNPFNPATVIKFSLPAESNLTLTLYNLLGEKVHTIFEGNKPAGHYEINFDAASVNGMTSGIYFYEIKAVPLAEGGRFFRSVKKMVLIK